MKRITLLSSSSGDDVLRGGAGNDTLNAGAGNDFLYGEEGDDILILGGSGHTVFDGGEGVDTVIFEVIASEEFRVIVDFDNGYMGGPTEVIDPRYDTFTNVENMVLIAEKDNDATITGDNKDNEITTDGGNDVIDLWSG